MAVLQGFHAPVEAIDRQRVHPVTHNLPDHCYRGCVFPVLILDRVEPDGVGESIGYKLKTLVTRSSGPLLEIDGAIRGPL